MRTCSLLVVVAAAAAAIAAVCAAGDPSPWRPVVDVEKPLIQNLGEWAVVQQGSVLAFDKVVSARVRIADAVYNLDYELTIRASIRVGAYDMYRAVVLYATAEHKPEKLLSFEGIVRAAPPV